MPGGLSQPPPLHSPTARLRLLKLRDRATQLHAVMANIARILIVLVITYFLTYVLQIFSTILLMMFGLGAGAMGGSSLNDPLLEILFTLGPFTGMLLGLILAIVIVSYFGKGIRKWVDGMHETRYRQAASYLHHTDFLRVVAEEDFTRIIIERASELPSLKWISPATPKTIEDQLGFSACYWNSIQQLSYGPGRLDNASLINGSWNHLVSRISLYWCCACCCMSSGSGIISVPLMLITCNYHLWRVARLCCIIDYIVEDRFAVAEAQAGQMP